jgi:SulP family sulfate permease
VLVDLTVAVEFGMIAAAFLFMRRMSEVTNVKSWRLDDDDDGDTYDTDVNGIRRRSIPAGVEVYEINGPFFFGAAETFKDTIAHVARRPKVLIVRMRNVPAIDSTGMHVLRDLVHRTRGSGTIVLLSDVHTQPLVALGRSGVLEEIGEANVFGNVDDALNRARSHLGLPLVDAPEFAAPTVARETPTSSDIVR